MTTDEIHTLAGLLLLFAERDNGRERSLTAKETADFVLDGVEHAAKEMVLLESRLRNLANTVVNASLYWSGEDEERVPLLKTARTLAGDALDDLRGITP